MSKRDDTIAALVANNDHNELLAHILDRMADLEKRMAALEPDEAPKARRKG